MAHELVIFPCRQVHLKRLTPVCENVESHLGPLSLQVRDELLQGRGAVHLQADGRRVAPVLQHVNQVGGVLDNEGHDGEEREKQHVEHV